MTGLEDHIRIVKQRFNHAYMGYTEMFTMLNEQVGCGHVAEVGIGLLDTAIWTAPLIASRKGHLYLIDSFKGRITPGCYDWYADVNDDDRLSFTIEAMTPYAEHVTIIRADLTTAEGCQIVDDAIPAASLSMVMLDAAHDVASVIRDHALMLPKVKLDGMIAVHDWDEDPGHRGVKDAVQAIRGQELVGVKERRDGMQLGQHGGTAFWTRS